MAECGVCDGSGFVCETCENPKQSCECDPNEQKIISCEECDGTGEVEEDDEDDDEVDEVDDDEDEEEEGTDD